MSFHKKVTLWQDDWCAKVQMSLSSELKLFLLLRPSWNIQKPFIFTEAFVDLMYFPWRAKKLVKSNGEIMNTYLVEKFPPLVVIGLFHCHTHRRVPNTLTGGQISIHVFTRARLDDLHPLGRRGSLAPTPRGWLWTHGSSFQLSALSLPLHFLFRFLARSHEEKGANWQFLEFTGLWSA